MYLAYLIVQDRLPVELSRLNSKFPNHRWRIAEGNLELANILATVSGLSPLVGQVLINRGITTPEECQAFLQPESQALPSPLTEFPDLAASVELLADAIASESKIVICGDYDADGMTSTALLLRALRWLGADVDYAIPSRMKDGYGINHRIVEECYHQGVQLILTVDNGISAYDPILQARELEMDVIITDHHDLPEKLPPANTILNPKLLPESSPYRGVAGVGVAYILAVTLAQEMGQIQGLVKPLLELFTLGTIADLAPLTGVNRRWVKRGLEQLPKSQLAGVQALIQLAGVQKTEEETKSKKTLKPEDIGFRLGPRINAIGRMSDPQIVIDLLTTDEAGFALEKAMQCESVNSQRQELCAEIEQEAITWIESNDINLLEERVLVIVRPHWHHGVIGIVASRLVERYGAPVFIGTYEETGHIRGSARGIPEFHVFKALESCRELLEKFGGHRAAGGFSLLAENLPDFQEKLIEFARSCLVIEHLKPLIPIDAETHFSELSPELYQQLNLLHPCGIENPDPVFCSSHVQVLEQKIIGKGHLKVTLKQADEKSPIFKAIAWRWSEFYPLPQWVDIAYKLRENEWNGEKSLEIELVSLRPSTGEIQVFPQVQKAEFNYRQRRYLCSLSPSSQELRIRNPEGKVLAIQPGQKSGLLGISRTEAQEVDITQSIYPQLIHTAFTSLGCVYQRGKEGVYLF